MDYSDENIIDLIRKAQNGDKEARSTLIDNNTGLVWSVVRRFRNRNVETEDLFQIGCIGLIKAVDKFDPSFNVRFSTYAVPMILGEIRRYFRDDGAIKVSRSLKELSLKARDAGENLSRSWAGRQQSMSWQSFWVRKLKALSMPLRLPELLNLFSGNMRMTMEAKTG